MCDRQTLYDGALSARGVHTLQSFVDGQTSIDHNAWKQGRMEWTTMSTPFSFPCFVVWEDTVDGPKVVWLSPRPEWYL